MKTFVRGICDSFANLAPSGGEGSLHKGEQGRDRQAAEDEQRGLGMQVRHARALVRQLHRRGRRAHTCRGRQRRARRCWGRHRRRLSSKLLHAPGEGPLHRADGKALVLLGHGRLDLRQLVGTPNAELCLGIAYGSHGQEGGQLRRRGCELRHPGCEDRALRGEFLELLLVLRAEDVDHKALVRRGHVFADLCKLAGAPDM
mmetsp:Transcript_32905/g.94569  ORF Transcript_32905/g.94569 Transcript_32905/m.94569 type:complete len:201 (+) Transcript_32905:150-752(+)